MRKSFPFAPASAALVLATLSLLGMQCVQSTNGIAWKTLEHDGLQREYGVFIPADAADAGPLPLVLVLHGGNGTSRKAAYATRFNEVAAEHNFIVVYPQGMHKQWNDGRGKGFRNDDVLAVDDVGFIDALIDAVASEYAVDPARLYATGMSNGAMMCNRLGCELSGRLAAIAPVIGAMPENQAANCRPESGISVLMMNGTADRFVPWDGGAVAGREAWGRVLSVEETASFWAEHNGCVLDAEPTWLEDAAPDDGTRVWTAACTGANGAEVMLYGIEGGGHTWPGGPAYQRQLLLGTVCRDLDATRTIWAFFEAHPKPGAAQ